MGEVPVKTTGFRTRLHIWGNSKKNSSPSPSRAVLTKAPPCSQGAAPTSKRKDSDGTLVERWVESLAKPSPATRQAHLDERNLQTGELKVSKPLLQAQQEHASTVKRDSQTGELLDHTNLLHSLAHDDLFDAPTGHASFLARYLGEQNEQATTAKLPPNIFDMIIQLLPPADVASLAVSCKAFRNRLGSSPLESLNHPDNHQQKVNFLRHLDADLPNHLLCVVCAVFHLRIQPRRESLKPADIANPVFECPHAFDNAKKAPRMRIAPGRTLPFTFVQLALRAKAHSLDHGITTDSLGRRWKDPTSDWSHATKYHVDKGHLLFRCTSQHFAPPGLPPAGLRHLLYTRSDFTPYFSVCAHWRDGLLMPLVKCALSHIPVPPRLLEEKLRHNIQQHWRPQNPIISLCENCRPIRRCPECPTEYLIELRLVEDKTDPDIRARFKQTIVVTRWSDLGDGSSPGSSPEWAAINAVSTKSNDNGRSGSLATILDRKSSAISTSMDRKGSIGIASAASDRRSSDSGVLSSRKASNDSHGNIIPADTTINDFSPSYDSFVALGRRAISGIFESEFNGVAIPGQRVLSLNPTGVRLGESGHDWY